jgi:hypothetical protein
MSIQDESLLPSVQEFLAESLRNLRDDRLSLAILHAVTATELILKERLRRLSPALILRDIDTKNPQRAQTVSLAALPHRLSNLGQPLASEDAQLVCDIAEWRHQIVHYLPAYDSALAARQLPKLLDFLATQLRTELGTPLEAFLEKKLYRDASRYIGDWHNAVMDARERAAAAGDVVVRGVCPHCGGVEVMSHVDQSTLLCHLCHSNAYVCDSCIGCGRKMIVSYEPDPWGEYCDSCLEAAGDQYAEMESDLRRGK